MTILAQQDSAQEVSGFVRDGMPAMMRGMMGLHVARRISRLRVEQVAARNGQDRVTVIAYGIAGIATIGYLLALASGPAAVVVPLVATSPAVAGLLGIAILKEKTNRRQLAGIALALAGAVLLSVSD